MLKKLLASKKILAVIVALVVIIADIVIAVVISQDAGNTGMSGVDIELENNEDVAKDNANEQDEPYNGDGLEIEDEHDGTVDSVDASGDWDGASDVNSNNKQDNETDNSNSDDTQSDDDIIVDDKVWGEPS